MSQTVRSALAIAVVALGASALGACSAAPSGGGGGGTPGPTLTTGCFPGLLGGSWKIVPGGFSNYYSLTAYSDGACTTGGSTPITIYPGTPGPNAASTCESLYGPDAAAETQLSGVIVPAQDFWYCNVPL